MNKLYLIRIEGSLSVNGVYVVAEDYGDALMKIGASRFVQDVSQSDYKTKIIRNIKSIECLTEDRLIV